MVTTPSKQSTSFPFHPAKTEFAPGVAMRVTTLLAGYDSLQSDGQLLPGGWLEPAPVPAPVLPTVRALRGPWVKLDRGCVRQLLSSELSANELSSSRHTPRK